MDIYNLQDIRELLIETMHSNDSADSYFHQKLVDREMLKILVRIALDDEDFGGDAPMAAGDYIHQYPAEWLKEHEASFLDILKREYSDARPEDIALALAKFKSLSAKSFIEKEIRELEWGPRCERFEAALALYDD